MVRDLVAANLKALEAVNTDHARYLQIVAKRAGQPQAVLEAAIDNCAPRPEMDTTMFYRMSDEMRDLGMIRNDVAKAMDGAVNYSFVAELTGRSKESLGYVSYEDFKAGKKAQIR